MRESENCDPWLDEASPIECCLRTGRKIDARAIGSPVTSPGVNPQGPSAAVPKVSPRGPFSGQRLLSRCGLVQPLLYYSSHHS